MTFKFMPLILLSPLFILLSVFVYWGSQSFRTPLTITLLDYGPKTLSVDDSLTINYQIKVKIPCLYDIEKSLVNLETKETFLIGQEVIRHDEDVDDFKRTISIPKNVPDGYYEFVSRGIIQCSPIDFVFQRYENIIGKPVIIKIVNEPIIAYKGEMPSSIVAGDVLKYTTKYERTRVCVSTIAVTIFNEENRVVHQTVRPGVFLALGKRAFSEETDTSKLPPGKYHLILNSVNRCNDKVYLTEYLDQYFDILPKVTNN